MQVTGNNIPSISSYWDAKRLWDATKPMRGKREDEKPFARRGDYTKMMIQYIDRSIAFRYHRTNVVTYWPDGRMTLVPYASNSTNAIVREITPYSVDPLYTNSLGELVRVGDFIYKIRGDSITLQHHDDHWYVENPARDTEPFHSITVDRIIANAAYKAFGLRDYSTWLKAREALTGVAPNRNNNTISLDEIRTMLADPTQWITLDTMLSPEKMREIICYNTPGAYRLNATERIRRDDLDAFVNNKQKYGRIISALKYEQRTQAILQP